MDDLNLRGEKFDAACDCGASVSRTIDQWQRNPTAECPECGTRIKVDVSDIGRSVHAVDRSLADLDRQIRKNRQAKRRPPLASATHRLHQASVMFG